VSRLFRRGAHNYNDYIGAGGITHADATPVALWKVMAKQLCNDTMVRSQRSAFDRAKLDSRETIDDLSERLQNLAVGLSHLNGAGGDEIAATFH
jgi:hypothetical protein